VSVRRQLAGFITMQHLLDRRAALHRERDTPPEELRALRARHVERQQAVEKLQLEQATLVAERAALQSEVAALNEEREHFRRQKTQVTNMRQLTAVVSELDHVDAQLKPKEERIVEIGNRLQALEPEAVGLDAEGPEDRALREKGEAAWAETRARMETELHDVERDLRQTQRELGEAAWATFKKLWAQRKPRAVAAMEGQACTACHADLRPSLVQLVRTMEELQFCDSCRRLLYDPEQFNEQP
jgi:uncharacterized protein